MGKWWLALLLWGLWLAPASADEYRFAGDQFPFLLEQNGADISGLGADVSRRIMERLGLPVKIDVLPWKRVMLMAEKGNVDAVIGPYRTALRETFMEYTVTPFYLDRVMLFAPAGTGLSWDGDLSALKGKKIAVVRGWSNGDRFDSRRADLDVTELESLEAGLRAVALGHYDLVVGNLRHARVVIDGRDLQWKVEALEPALVETGGYITLTRKGRLWALRDKVNQQLIQMRDSGELARLQRAYGF
ncbi:substrate-binding periplasmic protein [Aestuariirhabdus sp. LZHN29]|uniref:substrate-binding periplasmic protein n=1 Tax=Aestuariirhabdus sp. LZHN29 TaxID=3417462 RepID=UPI003CEB89A5